MRHGALQGRTIRTDYVDIMLSFTKLRLRKDSVERTDQHDYLPFAISKRSSQPESSCMSYETVS
jgi:hypothetical protein